MYFFSDNTQLGILKLVKSVQDILIPYEYGRPSRFISSLGLLGKRIWKMLDLSSWKHQFSSKKGVKFVRKGPESEFPALLDNVIALSENWVTLLMIFMALGTLPPPLLPALPLPHQRGLPSGCRRPLRRAINTKDELLEGSHVLVALGSSVRS